MEAEISGTKLNIQYNGTKATDEKNAFAVWSNVQDDLHWYDADAKGATYVELSRHKSYGLYFVHPYAFSAKVPRGLNGMTVTLPKPKIETTIKQVNQTRFEVLVRKVPATVTSITVPVWSDKNGQDDLKWYQVTKISKNGDRSYQVTVSQVPDYISSITLPTWSDCNGQDDLKWIATTKQVDGTYQAIINLQDHNFDAGHYSVHVYGQSRLGAQFLCLAGTEGFTVKENQVVFTQPEVKVINY